VKQWTDTDARNNSFAAVFFDLFLPDFCPAGKNLEEKRWNYLAAAGDSGRGITTA
jgi:hypothetical protein